MSDASESGNNRQCVRCHCIVDRGAGDIVLCPECLEVVRAAWQKIVRARKRDALEFITTTTRRPGNV